MEDGISKAPTRRTLEPARGLVATMVARETMRWSSLTSPGKWVSTTSGSNSSMALSIGVMTSSWQQRVEPLVGQPDEDQSLHAQGVAGAARALRLQLDPVVPRGHAVGQDADVDVVAPWPRARPSSRPAPNVSSSGWAATTRMRTAYPLRSPRKAPVGAGGIGH